MLRNRHGAVRSAFLFYPFRTFISIARITNYFSNITFEQWPRIRFACNVYYFIFIGYLFDRTTIISDKPFAIVEETMEVCLTRQMHLNGAPEDAPATMLFVCAIFEAKVSHFRGTHTVYGLIQPVTTSADTNNGWIMRNALNLPSSFSTFCNLVIVPRKGKFCSSMHIA